MIKLFESFNEYRLIEDWLEEICPLCNYIINDDLTVDVNGSVNISYNNLTEIPIQFGKVSGDFLCKNNRLTNLNGCPKIVEGSFYCNYNNLITLEGCPEIVGKNFNCAYNQLTSLIHLRIEVSGNSFFNYNPLPDEILGFVNIKLLIKYQDDYSIWNADGSFNKGRWDMFIKDFETGILK